ncbi:MAG TPA: GNAT family N-acetyltransferase [Jatrophihabitans sp.]|nr:GNAT family N-acetyltransferase [Jatrophihabitans sp.]
MDLSATGIRRVREADVAAVVGLVYELAEYERLSAECRLTPDQLHQALFGPAPALFGHVAEVAGTVAGYALWFLNYSTWKGSHGIYLLDLYVQPGHRGSGLGRGLLAALAEESCRRGLTGVEWEVLDWNTPAIGFYRALGAEPDEGWTTYRLTGHALSALAGG